MSSVQRNAGAQSEKNERRRNALHVPCLTTTTSTTFRPSWNTNFLRLWADACVLNWIAFGYLVLHEIWNAANHSELPWKLPMGINTRHRIASTRTSASNIGLLNWTCVYTLFTASTTTADSLFLLVRWAPISVVHRSICSIRSTGSTCHDLHGRLTKAWNINLNALTPHKDRQLRFSGTLHREFPGPRSSMTSCDHLYLNPDSCEIHLTSGRIHPT